MKEITKFDVQFLHEGSVYKVGLGEANEKDSIKIQLAGRLVTPFEYKLLPIKLKEIFASLDETNFSSEKKLMKKLKEFNLSCFSITKKVYDLGTCQLLKNHVTESKYGMLTKEKTYQGLRSSLSSDHINISILIQNSKLPAGSLFEIADKIEREDRNAALAHAVREASRSFNLGSAVEHLCENLTVHCIKEDLAVELAAGIRKNLLNGNYEGFFEEEDFANAVTQDLQTISHNRHLFVLVKEPIAEKQVSASAEKRLKELEASNFGFGELRTPPKGTAYLEIHSFENPKELIDGKPLSRKFAMATLKQIADSEPEALIIDLRNHGGGSVYMSELVLSYFLEEGLPLTSFEYKENPQDEELLSFPLESCQTLSYEQLPKDQRLLDVPLYVLTSHQTFSAGEDIACHLKERHRATLIGETTGGGGDPNKLFDAKEFLIAMPVGFANVPYGPSWEGVGVGPHIPIENNQDALLIANQLISEKKKG